MSTLKDLAKFGLYSPEQEHDSCGVGVVANIKGVKSHQIVSEGIQVLINLGHRGACGRDPETGDGSGVLIQMPDSFFRIECASLGITLPPLDEYGVGMVFLPPQEDAQAKCEALIEKVIVDEGLVLLGWRDVPTDPTKLGKDARAVCPKMRQVFIGRGSAVERPVQIERKLYVVRKVIEHALEDCGLTDKE
ncbi:MAG TPA: glutamate synthase subunit alpha, partial [Dehalococcoidia bacterium]|nr:glutamate synthase subunit alpha [Dehalococcoidia bacterium]